MIGAQQVTQLGPAQVQPSQVTLAPAATDQIGDLLTGIMPLIMLMMVMMMIMPMMKGMAEGFKAR